MRRSYSAPLFSWKILFFQNLNEEKGTEEELYYIISRSFRTVLQTTVALINEKLPAVSAFFVLRYRNIFGRHYCVIKKLLGS